MPVRKQISSLGASRLGGSDIPAEMVERAAARLSTAAILLIVAFAVSVGAMNYAPPPAGDVELGNWAASASVLVSLAMIALTRIRSIDPPLLLDIALVYEVLMGFGIAMTETFLTYDPDAVVRGVSWVCLWITLFPVVVPATRGKMLLAALGTASMGVVALLVAVAVGVPSPDPQTMVYLVLPNLFAAGLAMIIHGALDRLRSDVNKAREMGAYKMVERLGAGGMGEVWRATHRMLARPAAIKLIRPEALGRGGADAATLRARFEREARATALLTSPHTIHIYDFGVTDQGTLYYVMELLDGTDLQSLVDRHGRLPSERVAHYLRQICDSLAEAHREGLVHRDLKPANLYACRLGERVDYIKVLDFGLVALRDEQSGHGKLTQDDQITGTPAYIAPEMVTGKSDLDPRADVYAIGCIAYFLLTGQLVFEGQTPMQILYGHVHETPARPSMRGAGDIDPALEALVLRCLEKDPADRPADAGALGGEVRELEIAGWPEETAHAWWDEHEPERIVPQKDTSTQAFLKTAYPAR